MTDRNISGYLPNMIGPVEVHDDGGKKTARGKLKFAGTITDDPDNDQLIIPTGGGGGSADLGKTVKPMVDADQSLTDAEGRKGLVQTTGALTAKRKLAFAAPVADASSYSTPVLNTCTGASIIVTVGTGHTIEIEPGAKALLQITASGVAILVDLPLDPRDFGCPWDGVNDDLPGLNAMLAAIPATRQRPTLVQLPKSQGYSSDDWHITKCIHVYGHGHAQSGGTELHNGIRFAPLKGVIYDGAFTSPTYPASNADKSRFVDVALLSTQAVVTDAGGNIGRANFFLDTTVDVWSALPASAVLGTVVLRSGAPVGSIADYINDGATRNTTHLVMFRCTTAGTKGSTEPAGFATAGLAQLGTTIAANGGGTAVWTVESVPKDYANVTAYVAGQRVIVPGEPDHVFECVTGGTSKGWATTIAAGSNGAALPQATINVASAAAFPAAGTARVLTSAGFQLVTYTGKTGTTLTGCSGGTGTMSTGGAVTAPFNYTAAGVACRVPRGMLAPSYRGVFYDRSCGITAGSDGAALPQATINVDDTSDFAASGTIQVWTGAAYVAVAYTGKTDTTFTGCTGGTGTMTTQNAVGQGVKWKHIPSQLATILANFVDLDGCALLGATGVAAWVQSNVDISAANGQVTTGGSVYWRLRNCLVQWSGSGLQTNSNNSDGGVCAETNFNFLGAGRTNADAAAYLNTPGADVAAGEGFGNGGGLVKDRTQGNNAFRAVHGDTSGGIPYRNDLFAADGQGQSGSASTWTHIPEECALKSLFLYPAIVTGALGGVSDRSTATELSGGICSTIRAESKLVSDPSKSLHCVLGQRTGNAGAVNAFNLRFDVDSYSVGFGMTDDASPGVYPAGWFLFGKAEGVGFVFDQLFMFPRPAPAGITWPSGQALTVPMPFWVAQKHLWIGNGYDGDPRSIGFGAAPPVDGWFKRGSVIYNEGASVGQPIGWQCTVDGTPGTWVAMANL